MGAGHDELQINYSTSAAGSVYVELQDASGRPLSGYALEGCIESIGDSVQHTVRWKNGGDVGGMAGQPIRLRFFLKDADRYSFQFTSDQAES